MVNGSLAVARKAVMLKNAPHIKHGSFTIDRYAYCFHPLLLKSPQVLPYLSCCHMSWCLLRSWDADVSIKIVVYREEGKTVQRGSDLLQAKRRKLQRALKEVARMWCDTRPPELVKSERGSLSWFPSSDFPVWKPQRNRELGAECDNKVGRARSLEWTHWWQQQSAKSPDEFMVTRQVQRKAEKSVC